MTKKELQAFMKAKLAKTKVNDSVTTGAAASGQQSKNFSNANRRDPTKRQDFMGPSRKPPVSKKAPNATPSSWKGKGDELSSEDSEDDIAAANEKMRQASVKFAVNAANRASAAPVGKKKKGARALSRGVDEHK